MTSGLGNQRSIQLSYAGQLPHLFLEAYNRSISVLLDFLPKYRAVLPTLVINAPPQKERYSGENWQKVQALRILNVRYHRGPYPATRWPPYGITLTAQDFANLHREALAAGPARYPDAGIFV